MNWILVHIDRSLYGEHEVASRVVLKSEASSLHSLHVVFMNRILQTSSLERDDWCATDKEFMLNDTTRFECGWHQPEIAPDIDKSPIKEEGLRIGPEVVRVDGPHPLYPLSAICGILLPHVGRPTNQDMYLPLEGAD